METGTQKIELNELCLNNFSGRLSHDFIQDFTEDINISGYLVCKHDKRHSCSMGISFGNEVFCKSEIINSMKKNINSLDTSRD